jgi:hypothetical protein
MSGASMRCANGHVGATCRIDAFDFGPMNLSDSDAAALEAQIASSTGASTLVFVGNVDTQVAGHVGVRAAAHTTLHVYEAWQAPASKRLVGVPYSASHGGQRVVDLRTYRTTSTTGIDWSGAPNVTLTERVKGNLTQDVAQTFASAALATQTGLLVFGAIDSGGALHVEQFFRKIDVGQQHEADGAWLCGATQTACNDGDCADTADACTHQGGDGRGLLVAIHALQPSFDTWLRATQLLAPTEPLLQPKQL